MKKVNVMKNKKLYILARYVIIYIKYKIINERISTMIRNVRQSQLILEEENHDILVDY
ncbi:hypothetical protein HMPREF9453_01885 [Dialister succinatiphilus YIT 11850]|uniref:Uncharacterized protein n=1 Tax=Dialister succinatiphilus YIT 11850 TaxID=742743 RepID=H1D2P7_9FIRM|nr:hypothetical protein HMPREF9453_01885 [Dialister succinatiphilus YIT 11850]